ncbi:hypothetical protein AJ80_06410 [Polytolypa hystricis UAMH7299]|uniref:Uncharacterized protein n=1 Tax=Polytolypa hystricis (strain UAMH7299) TaxID=1447883 RepID=A0A2B7XN13_POLH7|nr:hypothetical protein AJ80_06410 [Polytolypa hystricis UAMH7299]
MSRTVFLLVFRSPLFPAHWALWIPSADDKNVGKVIEVDGSVHTGFEHSIDPVFDLSKTTRTFVVIKLGEISDDTVVDSESRIIDPIEQVALSVPAPGPTLNPVASNAPPKAPVQLSNCQNWITKFVAELVCRNLLDASANEVVQNAPKN